MDIKGKKSKCSPYSITERMVPELIPVLGSQPAGDVSHKPGGRLPLLSARPAVTPATLKRAATNFAARWTEAQWVWTVCLRLLPDSVANSAPESSTLTTRLPSRPKGWTSKEVHEVSHNHYNEGPDWTELTQQTGQISSLRLRCEVCVLFSQFRCWNVSQGKTVWVYIIFVFVTE